MTNDKLYLIEKNGDIKRWLEKIKEWINDFKSVDQLFLKIMELMIEDDLLYLLHLETEIEKIEDQLIENRSDDFISIITKYRHKLSEFDAYYEQLIMIADLLRSKGYMSFINNAEAWNYYLFRVERLHNQVHLLKENIVQLRELYQSLLHAQQNKAMCILTVVTTIFLPPTLLTGWYGMNFTNMPELEWEYGYVAVLIIVVVMIVLELIYFKRKKLL